MSQTVKVPKTVTDDPRWAQVRNRDRSADGRYVYSVSTTGVYCRPSCGARLPRPEHVRVFYTTGAAQAAGFRACRRCKPDQPPLLEQHRVLIERLCRLIEGADAIPTLKDLAQTAGLSPFHLHRIFQAITGVTPAAYARAHRAQRLRAVLSGAGSVTEAIVDAGFVSSSRFYEAVNQTLGMTAQEWRASGRRTRMRFAIGQCSLGSVLVAASERGVCAILIGDDPQALLDDLQNRFREAELVGADAEFERWVAQVLGLIESPLQGVELPLDLRGTLFQQRVWRALTKVPAGSTVSYSELAARVGMPQAVRAVASACARNHLAVVVPCHRVVRSDGGLSGYRWGVDRKRELLLREGARVARSEVQSPASDIQAPLWSLPAEPCTGAKSQNSAKATDVTGVD